MKLKTLGNGLLLVALLLAAAGIVEPASATSAAVTALLFTGFAIVTWQSHQDWSAGYQAAQLDMTFKRSRLREMEWANTGPTDMWKCGMDDCECESNPKFREWDK